MNDGARKIRLIMELRQTGITDARVLSALERVPRERFVAPSLQDQAYDNMALPIGHDQTISQPYVVAFMTQALEVGERMRVLEIGTGSGYQASVLAHLCRRVYTIERYRSLMREAQARFQELGLDNVTTRFGDGMEGWPEQAPFDRIIVTAATKEAPPVLLDELAVGGVMVIPMGGALRGQDVVRIRRTEEGLDREELLPVRFVPLVAGVARES